MFESESIIKVQHDTMTTYLVSDISNRSISTRRPVCDLKSFANLSFCFSISAGGVLAITKTTPSCGRMILSNRWVKPKLLDDTSPSGLSLAAISILSGSSNLSKYFIYFQVMQLIRFWVNILSIVRQKARWVYLCPSCFIPSKVNIFPVLASIINKSFISFGFVDASW